MPTVDKYQKTLTAEEQAYQFFLSRGYSPQAIAGIIGNLSHESKFRTSAEGDVGYKGGSSFGIAQWRESRLKNLKSRYGKNWNTLDAQLDFVDWELNNTHRSAGNKLKIAKTVDEAGQAFSDLYEVPAKKYHEDSKRRDAVEMISRRFGQTPTYSENTSSPVIETRYIPPIINSEQRYFLDSPENSNLAEEEKQVKKELQQEKAEYDFRQDLIKSRNRPLVETVIEEEPVQEYQAKSAQDIFAEASNFVDNPILQQGGATRQDSLDVYNRSRLVEKYYKDKGYKKEKDGFFYPLDKVSEINLDSFNDYKQLAGSTNIVNPTKYQSKKGLPAKDYRREIDKNKYEQREISNLTLNGSSPMQLFDKRIAPTGGKSYTQGADVVDIYSYNTIANKPFDMLTDAEKKQRIETYGRDGVPKSYGIKKEEESFNTPIVNPINELDPAGLVMGNSDISTSDEILSRYIQPKYWDIQDNVNSNFGGVQTNYRITPETAKYMLSTIAPEPYNSRKVTPYYQEGGQIGNLSPEQTSDVESQRQWLNYWNQNRIIDGVKINNGAQIPNSTDIYVDDLNYGNTGAETTLGEFDAVTNRLIFDQNYQSKPGIPVHEFTHRFQKEVNPQIYETYINKPFSQELKNIDNLSEYRGDVQENQAELNRFRYNNKLRPDQIITKEDIDKYNFEDYNLKHFSKDQILNLLNSTAGNINTANYYAQQGGEIVKDNAGYWNPDNWGKVVEIDSPNITMEGVNQILLGVADTGEQKLMMPNKNYYFEGAQKVTEYPLNLQNYFNKR